MWNLEALELWCTYNWDVYAIAGSDVEFRTSGAAKGTRRGGSTRLEIYGCCRGVKGWVGAYCCCDRAFRNRGSSLGCFSGIDSRFRSGGCASGREVGDEDVAYSAVRQAKLVMVDVSCIIVAG